MKEIDLDYNSSKENLIIPEYGRHVQNLINYAKTIEDPEERQVFAERLTRLMMQMNPQSKNLEDYEEKLWKHFFRIAKYEIEVNPPIGERPTKRDERKYPERVPYSNSVAKFRHYGLNVQQLIEKAVAMEEGPVRDGFVAVIGSYMKLAYRTWNKDLYVSDEVIKADLESLSDGKLRIPSDVSIDNLSSYMTTGNKRPSSGGRTGGSRQGARTNSGRTGGRTGNAYKSKGGSRGGSNTHRRK
ncbi:MAG: DUF4290 domain-containing protein [Saprospiraceae bacterium]|nr:DUF4290 domain-containing protein [Saprospiraceae bacterium]MCB9324066.1 DUF4290 domain-containing protein [Lewinellaceae bacterium]